VLELGIFGGVIFPSSDANLRYEAYPQQPYGTGAEIGARLGYYPLSWLGLEGEAMSAASKVKDTETSAALYALRGQLVLQAPLPYVTPFLLAGAGRLGAISRTMANDSDPAWHFGIGAKLPLTHLISARLDLRDTLTRNVQQDGLVRDGRAQPERAPAAAGRHRPRRLHRHRGPMPRRTRRGSAWLSRRHGHGRRAGQGRLLPA
jgi:hypothetical protein